MRQILLAIYLLIASSKVLFLNAQVHYTTKQIDSLLSSNEKPSNWDLKKNVSYLNNLYKESEKIHYEKGMYEALFKITNWYMFKREYKNVFPYFEIIKKLPVKDPENYKYKAAALQTKAAAFVGLGFYDDAQVAIDESMSVCNNMSNNDRKYRMLGKAYDEKAGLYIEMKKPEDSVLFYFKKAARQYQLIKNKADKQRLLNSAYINISTSFFEAKKLDSSMFYSYKVLKCKQIEEEYRVTVYQNIGQVYREKKNWDSAFYYYKKAEMLTVKIGDPLNLRNIYQTLSDMYSQSGEKDKALLYAKKYSSLLDSLNVINKESAVIANKSIKEELRKENETQQKYFYWIIIGSIIVLVPISLYFFKNYTREKDARLDGKTIIEYKEIELKELKSRVNDAFEEVAALAKHNDSSFLCRFREVYPDFCNNIQKICPDILNSELTFCAYLKLNFSTKEIATYTFITTKSVQNRKNRLRKRLNIPSDQDIYIWIGKV